MADESEEDPDNLSLAYEEIHRWKLLLSHILHL
jgi:hypothetical protein